MNINLKLDISGGYELLKNRDIRTSIPATTYKITVSCPKISYQKKVHCILDISDHDLCGMDALKNHLTEERVTAMVWELLNELRNDDNFLRLSTGQLLREANDD